LERKRLLFQEAITMHDKVFRVPDEVVLAIRTSYDAGERICDIARRLDIKQATVGALVKRLNRNDI